VVLRFSPYTFPINAPDFLRVFSYHMCLLPGREGVGQTIPSCRNDFRIAMSIPHRLCTLNRSA
jgi:hypothetical protein